MENYNMNSGKKYLDRAKKNDVATANYLDNYYKNLRESAQAEEARLTEQMMSGARFTNASRIARSRQRVQSLTEELNYTHNAATIGMTEVVSQIVESALLVDAEAYAELNPNYKEEIRETVRGLLENANIADEVFGDTQVLYEYVSETLPGVKEGKHLTEEMVTGLYDREKPAQVEMVINNLSGKVSSRVARLVEKEQKKIEKINKDLVDAGAADPNTGEGQVPVENDTNAQQPMDANAQMDPNMAQNPDANAQADMPQLSPEAQEIMDKIEQGQLDPSALDDMVNRGEIAPEVAEEIMNAANAPESQPMDPNMQAPGIAPQGSGRSIHIDPTGNTSISMPNGQLALNTDGSVDIQLMESVSKKLVRETPRCGLIESLAVNEATNMIKEGKEYNSDLCIANALMYVTVMESMDELGLLDVNENVYADIINRAGGQLSEDKTFTFRAKTGETVSTPDGYGVLLPNGKLADQNSKEAWIHSRTYQIKQAAKAKQQAKKQEITKESLDFAERIRQNKLNREKK